MLDIITDCTKDRSAGLKISMAGSSRSSVKIEDFNMPFIHLVGLLVKFALAAIPAAIILTVVYVIIGFVLTFFGVGFLSMF